MFKNKFYIFAILTGLILTLVLIVDQLPVAKSQLRDTPVAIVNLDKGATGKSITQKILKTNHKSGKKVLRWHEFKSEKTLKKAMNEQRYYAAIVIPKDFSAEIATLPNPTVKTKASMKVMVNQGMNATVTTSLKQVLSGIVTGVGQGMQMGILANMAKANLPVPATVATKLAQPIQVQTQTLHRTSGLTAANAVFFQPIWLTSMIMSLLIYYAGRKRIMLQRRERFQYKMVQITVAAGLAIMTGLVSVFYAQWILGYNFDNVITLGLFLSIASFAFMMLFSGVITWLGVPGVAIFGLLLFFSAPLMSLAPQMLPHFYQQWILPWLPMRFLFDGARDMLFYRASIWNTATSGLLIILCLGLTLFFTEIFSPKHRRQTERTEQERKRQEQERLTPQAR